MEFRNLRVRMGSAASTDATATKRRHKRSRNLIMTAVIGPLLVSTNHLSSSSNNEVADPPVSRINCGGSAGSAVKCSALDVGGWPHQKAPPSVR